MHESDLTLVERAQGGDRQAFASLIERYKVRVFHTCYRLLRSREEAEEAAQDTFVRAYRGLGKFRQEASFSTWIYRICYNQCLDRMKKLRSQPVKVSENKLAVVPDPSTAEASLSSGELQDLIDAVMAELPDRYRAVLVLYHIQQLSYQEIAEVLGEPINSVKTHLFRGRALLREKVLERMPEEEWAE